MGMFDDLMSEEAVNTSSAVQTESTGMFDDLTPGGHDSPTAFGRGWQNMKSGVSAAIDLAAGDTEGLTETLQKRAAYQGANPKAQHAVELGEAWENGDGVIGGVKNVAGEVWKDLKEEGALSAAKDVYAMGQGIVEQVPNMVAPMAGFAAGTVAGGAAGGAAGSAVPVIGNAAGAAAGGIAGGWAGASTGNALVEASGQIEQALAESGIDVNNTQAVIDFLKENRGDLMKQAAIKGGTIGAIDTLTMRLGSLLFEAPMSKAVDRALVEMGVDKTSKAAVKKATRSEAFKQILGNDAELIAANTASKKAARAIGDLAMESGGEFAGEFAGEGLATGNWDTKNAALEALSAVGQSAITVGGQMGYAGIKAPVRKLGQAIQTDVNMTEAAPQEAPQEAPEAQQAVPTDIDMTQAAQPAVPTEYDNETGQMGDIIPGGVDYDDFWQQAYSAADEIHEAAVAQPEVSAIDTQAHEAATSPENDLSEPTEAQKEAGNYKKGHIKLHGMDITIENPAGSVRKGVDESGNAWETPINHHYGYIKGTVGFDKDHLDVVLGPEAESADTAYVIDQQNAEGGFDEHKVVIGATDEDHALEIYNSNYEPGWDGAAAVTPMPMDEFKAWAKSDAPKQGAASDAGKAVNIGDTIEYDGMTFSVDVNEETGNPVLIDPETGTMEEFESHEQFTAETGLSLADHIPGAKNMVETSGQVVDANNMVDNDQDAAISDSDSPASAEGSLSDFLKSQSAVEAEQGRVGSTIVDETGTVTGRVPSLNPTWVQEAAAMVGGVQKLRNAVEKFEAGGKLGRNQAEAVRLVREQYEQQAEDFEYRSNMESLEQGMSEEKEEAYPEYWDEETRSIAELSDEAMNLLGVDAVIDILESSRDDGAIAADLYQLIKDANDGRESERSSEVSEGARSQAPAEPAEAATEGTAEEVEPTYASSNVTAKQGEDLKLFNTPSTFGEGITPDNAEHVNSLDFSLEEEEAGLFDDQPLETGPVVDQETGNVSDNEAESKPDQEKAPSVELDGNGGSFGGEASRKTQHRDDNKPGLEGCR